MRQAGTIRSFAFLTFVAFLMSVTLPFYVGYTTPQAAAAQTEVSSSTDGTLPFGDEILICTADGFKWVSWQDLQSGKEQQEPHTQYECPLCYVSTHGAKYTVSAQTIAITYHQNVEHTSFYVPNITMMSQFTGRGFRTRAPPHIA